MKEYKFTLEDVLYLIDHNGDSDERIIISEHCEQDTWLETPMNSSLIWTRDNLERKVESIGVWGDTLQIWLADKDK